MYKSDTSRFTDLVSSGSLTEIVTVDVALYDLTYSMHHTYVDKD